ncbi:hypothetical protein, partial [Prevotellamassilia timonensis]|uniref:hypothetical protein n=1 Tax=Prevotellamassilia timonensis TaxID=1852370 RepID=UPI003079C028
PPFSIPTRDASPPLVLAFYATKPVSFLMPILNTLPVRAKALQCALEFYRTVPFARMANKLR